MRALRRSVARPAATVVLPGLAGCQGWQGARAGRVPGLQGLPRLPRLPGLPMPQLLGVPVMTTRRQSRSRAEGWRQRRGTAGDVRTAGRRTFALRRLHSRRDVDPLCRSIRSTHTRQLSALMADDPSVRSRAGSRPHPDPTRRSTTFATRTNDRWAGLMSFRRPATSVYPRRASYSCSTAPMRASR